MTYLNGNDNRKPDGDGNIVSMPTLAERDRIRREKEKAEKKRDSAGEPMINMPPVTKYLIGAILIAHLVIHYALSPGQQDWVFMNSGFVPETFNQNPFSPFVIASLFTHMFIHGGWMHVTMNLFMLAAFGSGVEKWLGGKRLLILYFASGLFGVAAHYLLNTHSEFPMIGASGGLSGLFAAALLMIARGQREMGGKVGILPFALIWIGLSIAFGMLGGPDGSIIAWAAHIGGFLGGFAVLRLMRV